MVIVDTSIWSAVLRRRNDPAAAVVQDLIAGGQLILLGPIRQEILSGIKELARFEILKQRLAAFDDLPLSREDYESAASSFNLCRSHGIQGSNTDFLICAASIRRGFEIYTADADFGQFAKHIPVRLYDPQRLPGV